MPAVPEPLDRRLSFGADGALYVSAGDGASFNYADYGRRRQPARIRAVILRGAPAGRDAADGRRRGAAHPELPPA